MDPILEFWDLEALQMSAQGYHVVTRPNAPDVFSSTLAFWHYGSGLRVNRIHHQNIGGFKNYFTNIKIGLLWDDTIEITKDLTPCYEVLKAYIITRETWIWLL